MTKIKDMDDFKTITSRITSFSHAYLFNVNSLEIALPYIKEFAKQIIAGSNLNKDKYEDIFYQIDNNEYDDLYIVNPDSISINTDEISKLFLYMETKSIHTDGKRIYIIYGFERLSNVVSNKILKFLEEPENNIYALLMTENIDKILPTIISRCQIFNFIFPVNEIIEKDQVKNMKLFINDLILRKKTMISYENDFFGDYLKDRTVMYDNFDIIERIVSETINKKCHYSFNSEYIVESLLNYDLNIIIEILNITNKLKCLIKGNINLNLLVDRYIIEVTEVLDLCKK